MSIDIKSMLVPITSKEAERNLTALEEYHFVVLAELDDLDDQRDGVLLGGDVDAIAIHDQRVANLRIEAEKLEAAMNAVRQLDQKLAHAEAFKRLKKTHANGKRGLAKGLKLIDEYNELGEAMNHKLAEVDEVYQSIRQCNDELREGRQVHDICDFDPVQLPHQVLSTPEKIVPAVTRPVTKYTITKGGIGKQGTEYEGEEIVTPEQRIKAIHALDLTNPNPGISVPDGKDRKRHIIRRGYL